MAIASSFEARDCLYSLLIMGELEVWLTAVPGIMFLIMLSAYVVFLLRDEAIDVIVKEAAISTSSLSL